MVMVMVMALVNVRGTTREFLIIRAALVTRPNEVQNSGYLLGLRIGKTWLAPIHMVIIVLKCTNSASSNPPAP